MLQLVVLVIAACGLVSSQNGPGGFQGYRGGPQNFDGGQGHPQGGPVNYGNGQGGFDNGQGGGAPPAKKFQGIPASFLNSHSPDGSANFAYQTVDGQARHESTGPDGTVRGAYSYMGPDGNKVTINYSADKNGFHASGPTVPTPPPVAASAGPEAPGSYGSQPRYNQQQPNYDDNDDGQYRSPPQAFGQQGGHQFPQQGSGGRFGGYGQQGPPPQYSQEQLGYGGAFQG